MNTSDKERRRVRERRAMENLWWMRYNGEGGRRREGGREGERKGGWEGVREGWRKKRRKEGRKERREGGREGRRERGRNGEREGEADAGMSLSPLLCPTGPCVSDWQLLLIREVGSQERTTIHP